MPSHETETIEKLHPAACKILEHLANQIIPIYAKASDDIEKAMEGVPYYNDNLSVPAFLAITVALDLGYATMMSVMKGGHPEAARYLHECIMKEVVKHTIKVANNLR